jgi:hypothetical protein
LIPQVPQFAVTLPFSANAPVSARKLPTFAWPLPFTKSLETLLQKFPTELKAEEDAELDPEKSESASTEELLIRNIAPASSNLFIVQPSQKRYRIEYLTQKRENILGGAPTSPRQQSPDMAYAI